MNRDEMARLATAADAVRRKHTREISLDRWEQPKHAHLLKAPHAFIDDVMRELSDDGQRGDPLPWSKMATLFRLRPHELTVWAGSNGSYKSTVLSEVMLSLAMGEHRVVVVSLEMPAYKVASLMAVQAFANPHPARKRVETWAESLSESLCFLDLTGDLKPAEVVKLTRYCAHELGTQHILIDNLTKIVSADNEATEQQRHFMAQMHRTAIDTGMHVHVVAHTRKPQGEEERPPGRYEIAGSRTLVDQPDNVVMIWRNRIKEARIANGQLGETDRPDLVLNICKQRHGRFEGPVGLWLRRDCRRFVSDWSEHEQPMVRD